MKDMQKLATRIFIAASLLFGLTGIVMVLSAPEKGEPAEWLARLLAVWGFIVLSSFGVSVGSKYLSDK
jgi:hypothetical protein